MRAFQGIQRAAVAVLAMGCAPAFAVTPDPPCMPYTRPEAYYVAMSLELISNHLRNAPPEAARAADLLRAGQRRDAAALLLAIGKTPVAEWVGKPIEDRTVIVAAYTAAGILTPCPGEGKP